MYRSTDPGPGGPRPSGFLPRAGRARVSVTAAMLLAAAFAFAACVGELGGALPSPHPEAIDPDRIAPPEDAPIRFTCDPEARSESPGWRRLNRRQYERTLRDLLVYGLGDTATAHAIFGAATAALGQVPEEERVQVPQDLFGSYRRLDQNVDQMHVDAWYEVALAVGALTTESPERLEALVGSCASSPGDGGADGCLRPFVEQFGERALRRPLAPEEVDFHLGFYGDEAALSAGEVSPAGVADVVAGLLTAPGFLYHVEHGVDPEGGDVPDGPVALSAFELASRLSYHFWDTMPDTPLLESARSGALLEEEELARQVDRLLADPRAVATAREFFRDWLKLEDLPPLNQFVGQPVFDAFVGEDVPGPMLRDNMIDEVLDLLEYLVFREDLGSDAIFTTDLALPRTSDLAALYGVEPVEGAAPALLPAGERPGLLTRAAFLATGTANTRPIHKGVLIRTNIMCDVIPPPPDNAAANVPELSETMSTREVVEALTEEPGTGCAGCHLEHINPLGFATENFDALGRLRTEQVLFDRYGEVMGVAPVNTETTVNIDGRLVPIRDAEDLMRALVESGKLEACIARHYFRYTFGRWEDETTDGCVLETLRTHLVETGSMAGMLRAVALTPEFRMRDFHATAGGGP